MNLIYAAARLPACACCWSWPASPASALADRAAQSAGRRVRRRSTAPASTTSMCRRPQAPTCRRSSSSTAPAPISRTRWCRSGRCSKAAPRCCSSTGPGMAGPERGPATTRRRSARPRRIAALMDRLGIDKAIIVGHSFGGAVDARHSRCDHPDKTRGPGVPVGRDPSMAGRRDRPGTTADAVPVVGWLFSETHRLSGGHAAHGRRHGLRLRPEQGAGRLCRAAPRSRWCCGPAPSAPTPSTSPGSIATRWPTAPRYREIKAPTVVISGDSDTVVYEEIHSIGLARDIPGAELVWVKNLGHKPDWIAPDLVVAAIEKVAGKAARPAGAGAARSRRGSPATPYGAGMRQREGADGANWRRLSERRLATILVGRACRPSRYRRCAACWWSRASSAARRR